MSNKPLHRDNVMPLEGFIISVLCCVEQIWPKDARLFRLWARGFAPKLADCEGITMEIVGEFLGFDSDQ